MRSVLIAAAAQVMLFVALGQARAETTDLGVSGTVGRHPIGLVVSLDEDHRPVGAHYSYASRGISIPLTTRVTGEQVELAEPGGGLFRLHFTSQSPASPEPLSFYTSTGLVGTWTKGSSTLPVSLRFMETKFRLRECVMYPNQPDRGPPPHFPDTTCDVLPDRGVLARCTRAHFASGRAVDACMSAAVQTCDDDQLSLNACVGNVRAYLDQTARARLPAWGWSGPVYRSWMRSREQWCQRHSEFSPDGSGYGMDIDYCVSLGLLTTIQKRGAVAPQPGGPQPGR